LPVETRDPFLSVDDNIALRSSMAGHKKPVGFLCSNHPRADHRAANSILAICALARTSYEYSIVRYADRRPGYRYSRIQELWTDKKIAQAIKLCIRNR